MAAGRSAGERAGALDGRGIDEARRWEQGELGEKHLARLLAPLTPDGYYPLFDRRRPGTDGNLDAVLVGPHGVTVIDAKNWHGTLSTTDQSLRCNGRRRDDQLESLRRVAGQIASFLANEPGLPPVPVWSVACFVGEATVGAPQMVGGVELVGGDHLEDHIRSLPPRLDVHQVEALIPELLEKLPPRSGRYPLPPTEEPDEAVLFLQRWKKSGHHHLYVKDRAGRQLGYIDVARGTTHCENSGSEDLLALVASHYQGDEAVVTPEPPPDTRWGLRRFLDPLLGRPGPPVAQARPSAVVACFWHNYGKRRLYVDRLDASGEKTSLGWYDLKQGYCHQKVPGARGVVAFCGSRYESFAEARRPQA